MTRCHRTVSFVRLPLLQAHPRSAVKVLQQLLLLHVVSLASSTELERIAVSSLALRLRGGTALRQQPAPGGWEREVEKVEEVEDGTCSCSKCSGKRLAAAGVGMWQCTKSIEIEDASAVCSQVGAAESWVVWKESLAYERFCLLTCKPVLPDHLVTSVPCEHLSPDVIKKYAQTPNGNGVAFVWRKIPMVDSLTLKDIQATPGHFKGAGAHVPMSQTFKAVFGKSARRRRSNLVPKGTAPAGCHFRCFRNATGLPSNQSTDGLGPDTVPGYRGDPPQQPTPPPPGAVMGLIGIRCPSCPLGDQC